MRRVMFTVAATVLMAGAAPASALAHHHHHRHHSRTHHAKIRRFGDQNTAPTSTSSSDNAGTVTTFSGGVLTITLNDGSTVKGMVTNDTELECTAPQQSSTTTHEDGDGGSGDNQGSGGDSQGSGDQSQGDDDQAENQQGEDQNEDQNENEMNNCSSSSLTPGAVVHEASLRIGSSGAVWQKVELVS